MHETQPIDVLLDEWEAQSRSADQDVDVFLRRHNVPAGSPLAGEFRRRVDRLRAIDGLWKPPTSASGETGAAGALSTRRSDRTLQFRPGDVVGSGYRLVSSLGVGGFGEVWKARGEGGFLVALKCVQLDRPAVASEIRTLNISRRIRHPNIVSVFASWQTDTHLFIAMELAGKTLQDRLREHVEKGSRGIPREELMQYMSDVARALDYLNRQKRDGGDGNRQHVQHCDIKPLNILLCGGGAKLADFGIAQFLDGRFQDHSGQMTPAYAPPEFLGREVSAWSDQYSLAVTYCELLCGKIPARDRIGRSDANRETDRDLSRLPESEVAVVSRALSIEPSHRWRSCREFVRQLEMAGKPPPPKPADESRRHPPLLGALVIVCAGAIALVVAAHQSERQQFLQPPEEQNVRDQSIAPIDLPAPEPAPAVSSDPAVAKAWHKGGTLYQKSALDWQTAGPDDKLATCAYIVDAMWKGNSLKAEIRNSVSSIDDLKPHALALVAFIDSATKANPDSDANRQLYARQSVAMLAFRGATSLGWVNTVERTPPTRIMPRTSVAAVPPATDRRSRWINTTYGTTVSLNSKGLWEEVDSKTGRLIWLDEETSRTDGYVQLFCPRRKYEIRLLPQRMEQMIDGKWQRVANGHWDGASTIVGKP